MKKKLLKMAFMYLWIWVQRGFSLVSFAFCLMAFAAYLKEFDYWIFAIQIGSGISSITAWKAAEYDERVRLALKMQELGIKEEKRECRKEHKMPILPAELSQKGMVSNDAVV